MILLLKIYLISWFISEFEPIQDLFDYLFGLLPENVMSYKIMDYLYTSVGCIKCLCLWITLCMTGNIFYAIGLSYIGKLINGKK